MKYERIRDLREDNELTQEYMGKMYLKEPIPDMKMTKEPFLLKF